MSQLFSGKDILGRSSKKDMGVAQFSLGAHPYPRHITCLNSLGVTLRQCETLGFHESSYPQAKSASRWHSRLKCAESYR